MNTIDKTMVWDKLADHYYAEIYPKNEGDIFDWLEKDYCAQTSRSEFTINFPSAQDRSLFLMRWI